MSDARLSIALPGHPKTKKLIRRLGEGGAWRLVCLILWTAANRPDGDLFGMTAEDVELAADWAGEPGEFAAALVAVGFLDEGDDGYSMHDWPEHQPWVMGSEQRAHKARWNAIKRHHGEAEADRQVPEYASKRLASADSNANSTANSNAPSPSPSPSPSPKATSAHPSAARFDEFWKLYPLKVGRKPALTKWKAKHLDQIANTLIADVKQRIKQDGRWLGGFIPKPTTYLTEERWDDEMQPRRDARAAQPAEPSRYDNDEVTRAARERARPRNPMTPEQSAAMAANARALIQGRVSCP